ncbi:N-acetylmuramoyl-L-alanine amidase [Nocardia sp. NPDC003979]
MKPDIIKAGLCSTVSAAVVVSLSGLLPVTAHAAPEPAQGDQLAGKTIFLDPGHQGPAHAEDLTRQVDNGRGGTKDCQTTGMTSLGGVPEHTINWEVAQLVKTSLQALGAEVVLSRADDAGWGGCVDDRARAANESGAEVAVSIHADSAPADQRGFHLILPQLPVPDPAVEQAQSQAGLAASSAVRDAYVAAGIPPATYGGANNGLQTRADVAGPALTRVPLVFVEMGNGANAEDAALLESREGRLQHAVAITTGLVGYLLNKPIGPAPALASAPKPIPGRAPVATPVPTPGQEPEPGAATDSTTEKPGQSDTTSPRRGAPSTSKSAPGAAGESGQGSVPESDGTGQGSAPESGGVGQGSAPGAASEPESGGVGQGSAPGAASEPESGGVGEGAASGPESGGVGEGSAPESDATGNGAGPESGVNGPGSAPESGPAGAPAQGAPENGATGDESGQNPALVEEPSSDSTTPAAPAPARAPARAPIADPAPLPYAPARTAPGANARPPAAPAPTPRERGGAAPKAQPYQEESVPDITSLSSSLGGPVLTVMNMLMPMAQSLGMDNSVVTDQLINLAYTLAGVVFGPTK